MINLDLSLLELNDLYYAVGMYTNECREEVKMYKDRKYFKDRLKRAEKIEQTIQTALYEMVDSLQEVIDEVNEIRDLPNFIDEEVEDEGPEYDSAGYTEQDRFDVADVNVRVGADEFENAAKFRVHFVDNAEADEDAGFSFNNKPNGVSQFILDFVEANGLVSYTEMSDIYKAYTGGSNSFSHILKALMIPYKNRESRRYLVKHPSGGYHIRVATIDNWVVTLQRK